MQQAAAPSHSPEDTLSLPDTAGSTSLTGWFRHLTWQGPPPPVVVPMWRAVGFLPSWGPCSCSEARLHLSATVLRSTTLASQPGHSPQPAGPRWLWVPQEGLREPRSLGRSEGGSQGRGRAAFCWERFKGNYHGLRNCGPIMAGPRGMG